jgi:general secretion pathway protein S
LKKSLLLAALVLTGCQSQKPPSVIGAGQQAQLSAVIASSRYLRDYCQRSDIAADKVLTQQMLTFVQKRGWAVDAQTSAELAQRQQQRYQTLQQDTTPLADKCLQLSTFLAPFSRAIQTEK